MTTDKELRDVLNRALADETFRARLLDDPHQATRAAGYDLTTEQLAALKAIDMQTMAEALDEQPVEEIRPAAPAARSSLSERLEHRISERTTRVPARRQKLAFALAAVVLTACLVVLLMTAGPQGDAPLAGTVIGSISIEVGLAFSAGFLLGGLVIGLWMHIKGENHEKPAK